MLTVESDRQYEQARFSSVMLSSSRLSGVEFIHCVFNRCVFNGTTFYRCRFSDCRFIHCDLSAARIPNCLVVNTRFEGCKLIGIDWTKAGDSEASRTMMSVHFTDCLLDYSSFFGLRLQGVTLVRCRAHEADFAEADMSGCDCRETDFQDSTFLHTRLEGADFRGATNYAIDPTANSVKKARFSLPEAVSLLRGFEVIVE